jgi:hypothetical protein
MFKPEAYVDSVLDLLDDEQTLVAENIIKNPLDMQERYMSLVPDGLLDFIVKQWRPGMTSDQADKIFRKYSSFNQGGSVTTPKRGLVDEAGSYAGEDFVVIGNKKISKERLNQLNEAAKKYGFKDFASVEGRDNRINVAKEATRRAEGVAEGKGRPGVKKDYQVKTGKKDLASEAYLQGSLKRTQNQANILETVQSGKYKTAEEIREAVKLDKEVFNKEVKNLFKNVYSQIKNLNKPKKSQPRFGVRFLPKDLEKLYEIRSKLGQIDGFESTEQRTIYSQIEKAYGQFGETPNRKAYQESVRKASDFSKIKNAIKTKYPEIVLEFDHPLDYKTIEGLGKKGEKFLYVTPIDKTLNRGFKEVLGKAYRTAVNNKDIQTISKIEDFAKDIGVTVGKVRGSKIMDYGTSLLRETDIGSEIISNLRQQNVIADKIKTLQKSGELKTIFKDIGVPRGGEKGFNIKGVSEAKIKGVQNLIEKIGCTDLAAGGRAGFNTGANCYLKGVEKINSGKIAKGAEAINFAKFANQAYKLGRNVLKFGVIPEMLWIGGETLIRMGMGEGLNESFKYATSFLPGGTARAKEADFSSLTKRVGLQNAKTIMNVRGANESREKLNDLYNSLETDLAFAGGDWQAQADIEKRYEKRIKDAEKEYNIKSDFGRLDDISSGANIAARRLGDEAEDIKKSKSLFTQMKNWADEIRPDTVEGDIETVSPSESDLDIGKTKTVPLFTMEDIAKNLIFDQYAEDPKEKLKILQGMREDDVNPGETDLERILFEQQQGGIPTVNEFVWRDIFSKAAENPAYAEQLYGASGMMGEPIQNSIIRANQAFPKTYGTFASGGIASLTTTIPPKRGPNHQGLASLKKYGKQY